MKLILENWKKFIVEGFSEQEQSRYKSIIPIADKLKEASQKFIENLKNNSFTDVSPDDVTDNIKDFISLASNISGATYIGSGKFRAAFSVDNDHIVKVDISANGTGKEMNKKDAEFGRKAEHSSVFPKSFAPSDDYSWIILEKVQPIEDLYYYIEFFPNSYIKSKNNSNLYYQLIKASFLHESGNTSGAEYSYMTIKGKWQKQYVSKTKDQFNKIEKEGTTTTLPESIEDVVKGFYVGPTFPKVVKAMKEFNIRSEEVRVNNVGVGENNRFVILDSSVEEQIQKGFKTKSTLVNKNNNPQFTNAQDVTVPLKR
jgi:hypothetical protein